MKLKIGNVEIANPCVLAPMAGVTDLPFRLLCKEQGVGLLSMEMVSAKAISFHNKNTLDLMQIAEGENPIALQIFGSDPEIMAQSAAEIEERPFDILDINMGCPVPKVVNNGEGSALMKNPKLAGEIVESFQLKEHVTMPLMPDSDSSFRLFLGDIGMFSYQSGINAASFVSSERENTLSGIFFENFVANELIAKEHKLFYWRGKASAELEFIVESDNRLYPIDVKKGRGTLNSLEKFSNHNKFEYAIKVSKNNYGYDRDQKLLTIPLYFIPFVAKDLADGKMRV